MSWLLRLVFTAKSAGMRAPKRSERAFFSSYQPSKGNERDDKDVSGTHFHGPVTAAMITSKELIRNASGRNMTIRGLSPLKGFFQIKDMWWKSQRHGRPNYNNNRNSNNVNNGDSITIHISGQVNESAEKKWVVKVKGEAQEASDGAGDVKIWDAKALPKS